jgi:hypothetical protein
MNALRERSTLVEGKTRGKDSGLEQKICQVALTFTLSSLTMVLEGLSSSVFFDTMYDDMEELRRAWAFMICSYFYGILKKIKTNE